MPHKGENIYKRKDGRWEGRMLKPDGRYRYLYAKVYREVCSKMKDTWKLSKPANIKRTNKKESTADLFETWLSGEIMTRLKSSTYENYCHCINKCVILYFRLPNNVQFSEESIRQLVEEINQNAAISVSYRRKILFILKMALREVYRDVLNHPSVAEPVTLPKVRSSKEVPVFSMKKQRMIEYAMQQSEDKRLLGIVLCFYSGIRLGELCVLKWEDFNFKVGAISIMRTVSCIRNRELNGEKTVFHVGTPKSETSLREIPLPALLFRPTEKYSLPFEEGGCHMPSGKAALFDPRIYQRTYKKVLAVAGVKDRKFHTIRRTFATRVLELGVDIKTLSEVLGHFGVNIALSVCTHSSMEQKKVATEKSSEMHVAYMKPVPFAVDSAVTTSRVSG